MKNTDLRVEAYITKAADFAQPILRHVRELVHQACPEVEETVKWNMPFFTYHGILCIMAAFKAHCTFGFWHQGMRELLQADGQEAESAMNGVGRVLRLADLPDDAVLVRYIREAAKLNESGAPARASSKPRPPPPTPPDLAAALKKKAPAAAAFAKFPPSHRREYIEWINEAKRPETRAKRIAKTIEQITQRKALNWKYAKS